MRAMLNFILLLIPEIALGATHMNKPLNLLLSSPNDTQLIDKLFIAISKKCDRSDRSVLDALPPEQRVVIQIWGSQGLVDLAGMEAVFRSDWVDLADIPDAYETVGLPRAAFHIRQAYLVFPNGTPPVEQADRLKLVMKLESDQRASWKTHEREFHRLLVQLERNLAAYIRLHAAAFDDLQLKVDEIKPEPVRPADTASRSDVINWIQSTGGYVDHREDHPVGTVQVTFSNDRNCTDQDLDTLSRCAFVNEVVEVDLDRTQVTRNGLASLRRFPQLRHLRLSGTMIGDADLEELLGSQISFIDLSDTDVTDDACRVLAKTTSLSSIWLSSTKVSDGGVTQLKGLPNLRDLNLYSTRVEGASFEALAECAIEWIRAGASPIANGSLREIKKLTQLKELDLVDTALDDDGLKFIAACTHLERLDLSRTRISSAGLNSIGELSKLKALDLSSTAVDDSAGAAISRLQRLEELGLFNTRVTNDIIPHLVKMPNLVDLGLGKTEVGGEGILQLKSLPRLKALQVPPPKNAGEEKQIDELRKIMARTEISLSVK